jgi:hypothetical protein
MPGVLFDSAAFQNGVPGIAQQVKNNLLELIGKTIHQIPLTATTIDFHNNIAAG